MTPKSDRKKELLSSLNLSKLVEGRQITDAVAMTVEFMRYEGEVAYRIAKKQAVATTSTVSSIGLGWSAFFFGFVQDSWLTSSLGLMLVFVGTYFLAYWTPRVLDRLRKSLDESEAAAFYSRWLSDSGAPANSKPQ